MARLKPLALIACFALVAGCRAPTPTGTPRDQFRRAIDATLDTKTFRVEIEQGFDKKSQRFTYDRRDGRSRQFAAYAAENDVVVVDGKRYDLERGHYQLTFVSTRSAGLDLVKTTLRSARASAVVVKVRHGRFIYHAEARHQIFGAMMISKTNGMATIHDGRILRYSETVVTDYDDEHRAKNATYGGSPSPFHREMTFKYDPLPEITAPPVDRVRLAPTAGPTCPPNHASPPPGLTACEYPVPEPTVP